MTTKKPVYEDPVQPVVGWCRAGASEVRTLDRLARSIVTSLGYNLSSDDGTGHLTSPRDQINIHPMLVVVDRSIYVQMNGSTDVWQKQAELP